MPEIGSTEGLMVWIMNRFSEVFADQAVLKGGMVLRLLNCPRHTNDLDYVFLAYKSKKDVVPLIRDVLTELEGAEISHSLHSTSLRFLVSYRGFRTQIEANVMPDCKTQALSTSALARSNNQLPRIIRIMSYDWALAHKLAAWNERGLMRDLYDAYFFHAVLDEMPDLGVLQQRLSKINYASVNKTRRGPKSMTLEEFLNKLRQAVEDLDAQMVMDELRDLLGPDELVGLDKKIKIGLKDLIGRLAR